MKTETILKLKKFALPLSNKSLIFLILQTLDCATTYFLLNFVPGMKESNPIILVIGWQLAMIWKITAMILSVWVMERYKEYWQFWIVAILPIIPVVINSFWVGFSIYNRFF